MVRRWGSEVVRWWGSEVVRWWGLVVACWRIVMNACLDEVCCAKLPERGLASLAPLRCATGVTVTLEGEWAWIRWPPENGEVLAQVLPVPGVELYERREDRWFRHGSFLPAFDVPELEEGRPLYQALLPLAVHATKLAEDRLEPVVLRLVRDYRPRATIALLCGLSEMSKWVEAVPGPRLASIRGAFCATRALLLGTRLPLIGGCTRFWGDRVLVPLGLRPEPDLPEEAILEALRVAKQEFLLMQEEGVEIISFDAVQPLTRSSLRLALLSA
jgi:hypothetical protein